MNPDYSALAAFVFPKPLPLIYKSTKRRVVLLFNQVCPTFFGIGLHKF